MAWRIPNLRESLNSLDDHTGLFKSDQILIIYLDLVNMAMLNFIYPVICRFDLITDDVGDQFAKEFIKLLNILGQLVIFIFLLQ